MRNEYNKVIFLASISQPAVIRTLRSNTECAQFVLQSQEQKSRA